jgi:hypothetical protein
MTDTAAAAPALATLDQQMTETPLPQMTKAQAVAVILARQESSFKEADYAERLAIAQRKGLDIVKDPSYVPTIEELTAAVPLKRDRLTYKVFAKNTHGLLSVPKQKGRRRPHMTQHQQAIKSASLRHFKHLMEEKAERLRVVCAKEGFEYLGVPESAIPEIGKQAAILGMREVNEQRRAKNRKARRRQQFSRGVNAGLTATSEKRYVNQGGQFGS